MSESNPTNPTADSDDGDRVAGADALTDRDWAMAQLLAARSQRKAADELGVSSKTVQRRMADPVFAQVVRLLRSQHYEDLTASLTDAAPEAVRALRDHLTGEEPGPCIQAAKAILQYHVQVHRERELQERIDRLEQQLDGDANEPPAAPWLESGSSGGS